MKTKIRILKLYASGIIIVYSMDVKLKTYSKAMDNKINKHIQEIVIMYYKK